MGIYRQGDGLRKVIVAAALALGAAPLPAQPVVGARAGVVSFAIGKVYLDNQEIDISPTHFPQVKENGVLRTDRGRAEVLLNPCAVLRVDEDSSFRLVAGDLLQPRVELLAGSAVVDVPGMRKASEVHVKLGEASVDIARRGTYRIDFSPPLLKVFEGRAAAERAGAKTEVSAGRMLAFDSPAAEKFDVRDGDGLDLWNHERAIVLARARAGQARSMAELAAAAAAGMGWPGDATERRPGMDPEIIRPAPRASMPATLTQPPLDTGCKF